MTFESFYHEVHKKMRHHRVIFTNRVPCRTFMRVEELRNEHERTRLWNRGSGTQDLQLPCGVIDRLSSSSIYWNGSEKYLQLRKKGVLTTTPCPSVHYNLCTYFPSGMAGPITMIFSEVKI